MAYRMIAKLSDHIVSPLALGTHENYECVKAGKTMLREYEGKWGIPGSFVASMMDEMVLLKACERERIPVASYTKFERMVILSVIGALRSASIDPRSSEVLFIIASTKGNIELLDERQGNVYPPERVLLTESARQITKWFHNPNEPLVVCNACISGLSAQIEAELAEFDNEEKKSFLADLGIEESGLDKLIKSGYAILGLISFLTAGPKEVRAWTITKGTKAPAAAGKIHSDFERGFIRAEVVSFDDLVREGDRNKVKEKGLLRSEGKEYVMHDGDVVEFLFNV